MFMVVMVVIVAWTVSLCTVLSAYVRPVPVTSSIAIMLFSRQHAAALSIAAAAGSIRMPILII
jgi:hypothetical protein